jgi:hypothetical protein
MDDLNLTPRRRAMLRYLAVNGQRPWDDVVRVVREIDGRFELGPEYPSSAETDVRLLRYAGFVKRVRVQDGETHRYPFTITAHGIAALAAPEKNPDAEQREMFQAGPELMTRGRG